MRIGLSASDPIRDYVAARPATALRDLLPVPRPCKAQGRVQRKTDAASPPPATPATTNATEPNPPAPATPCGSPPKTARFSPGAGPSRQPGPESPSAGRAKRSASTWRSAKGWHATPAGDWKAAPPSQQRHSAHQDQAKPATQPQKRPSASNRPASDGKRQPIPYLNNPTNQRTAPRKATPARSITNERE